MKKIKVQVAYLDSYPDNELRFKVGKRGFYAVDLVEVLSIITGKTKSEIKRLIKDGAVDLILPTNEED